MYLKWALNNANGGAMDFFSDRAFAYWRTFARRIIMEYKAIYGKSECPLIKPGNEWKHQGNAEGYQFSQWYVKLYDAIKDLLPGDLDRDKVKYIVCDTTLSEWVIGGFTHPHEARGYTVGEWRFVDAKKKRFVKPESHSYAVIENYKDGNFDIWLKNGFWKTAKHIFSEDGGSGYYLDEQGNRVYYGKGYRIGEYAVGDSAQTEEHTEYCQRRAREENRMAINTFMNIECLRLVPEINKTREDCRDSALEKYGSWDRAEAFIEGMKKGLAIS
jgi:hypothetical protein